MKMPTEKEIMDAINTKISSDIAIAVREMQPAIYDIVNTGMKENSLDSIKPREKIIIAAICGAMMKQIFAAIVDVDGILEKMAED